MCLFWNEPTTAPAMLLANYNDLQAQTKISYPPSPLIDYLRTTAIIKNMKLARWIVHARLIHTYDGARWQLIGMRAVLKIGNDLPCTVSSHFYSAIYGQYLNHMPILAEFCIRFKSLSGSRPLGNTKVLQICLQMSTF